MLPQTIAQAAARIVRRTGAFHGERPRLTNNGHQNTRHQVFRYHLHHTHGTSLTDNVGTGHIGVKGLTLQLVDKRGGILQDGARDLNGEHLEKWVNGGGFIPESFVDLLPVLVGDEDISSLQQDISSESERGLLPALESFAGSFDSIFAVLASSRGSSSYEFARVRIVNLEGLAAAGRSELTVNEERGKWRAHSGYKG